MSTFTLYSNNQILINDHVEISIMDKVYLFEDTSGDLTLDSIIGSNRINFKKNNKPDLNFGYTLSTYWLNFTVKNNTEYPVEYILNIPNPDLDEVEFFEFIGDSLINMVKTGETKSLYSRDIVHHKFLFNLDLEPNVTYTYFIKVKNIGDANNIPLKLQEKNQFVLDDSKENIIKWFIYGFLIFIVIFNFYLYRSLKEKLNLYYSLFILFGTLLNLILDGYHCYLNIPEITNRSKTLVISLFVFFLLKFSESFLETKNKRFVFNKTFAILRYIAMLFGFLYFFTIPVFGVPISAISLIGSVIIFTFSFLLIIIFSIVSLDRNYLPSVYFLYGFISALLGPVLLLLKEMGILPSNLLFDNSIRIGLTVESIFLTMAILERFRINQENAKKSIEESHSKIELQNKELEIINTELEKLSIVASETDNSVAIYDQTGRIEWCNEGFERFYETNISKLIKQSKDNIENIIPFGNVKQLFKKSVINKEPVIFEAQLKFKGKKDKWMRTTLSPYTKGNKVIAVDTDITSLKEYEADLQQAKEKAEESDRIKTIFLSNMSHEVRTPLNGILGFSELLINKNISYKERERYVEIIKGNGEQLIRIIDDILDMSLIETNQLTIWNSDFSLTEFCQEITNFFEFHKTTIGKSDIELVKEFNIDSNLDIVNTDNSRLKQVLTNLLKNAFKFTDKGSVKMGCSTNENTILFFVEDTGIGIEPSKINDVFGRFRQADERSTRKYGGNGLGLSIAKGIVDKMGGRIWIDPEYTLGFRICFVVPLKQSKRLEAKNSDQQKKLKINGKRILIVEDHQISYEYLEGLLQPFSVSLQRAKDGIEAIEKVKGNHFDLILMDINLPRLGGVEATKEVRKFNKDIPIIAQTAYAKSIDESLIIASGCNDIITKPINSKNLFEKIEANLE